MDVFTLKRLLGTAIWAVGECLGGGEDESGAEE